MDQPPKMNRTEIKVKAQEIIMSGVANQLGYYNPDDYADGVPEDQKTELREAMQHQADRVARLFGYEKAWSS